MIHMKRRTAYIASFFKRSSQKKPADRQGEVEKEQTDSESKKEEPPPITGPCGPPRIPTLSHTQHT